ncbi:glycosyltransferase [Zavarzinella formosa]|uniref:glycosyltransferase n=1 Tax=Zavarzinella formosa TaxID=360055 RepID=UPI00030C818E|nr:glycosyltransferase [Zavarzinella formosa]
MANPPRILFASYLGYFDTSSGAALATRDLLELLAKNGWSCGVVCGPELDCAPAVDRAAAMARLGLSVTDGTDGTDGGHRLFHTVAGGVRCTVFEPADWTGPREATVAEGEAFLRVFRTVAGRFQPDIVLTYGGRPPGMRLMALAKQMGFKVVFALHNFGYPGPQAFRDVDTVFVPSRFAQAEYARRGVTAAVLPGPIPWDRVRAPRVEGKYVTFVNPVPPKGVFVAARIMAELGRRRPDIPFLVVESRGGVDWLGRAGVDLAGVTTVHRMVNTGQPAAFYGVSRAVLMPSLWWESLGRVAVESLVNGIPVIASDRGALPGTLGAAGVCLSVPDRYKPESRRAPAAAEVKPWCDEIERLWDDAAYFHERRRASLAEAERWRPESLLSSYETFFQRLAAVSS